MSDDEDELNAYDLSAWDAPEPPADLADAILARMGSTDSGAVAPVAPPEPRRRWLFAAIAAAALTMSLGTYAVVRLMRRELPASGAVVAERAQVVQLPGARAELDPGADIRWRRDAATLRVEQRAGRATWRVDGDETLVIDAGAMGASVEATGASLRVEVEMNNADVRIIGTSALTSAAVAMITVVVYEGHVRTHHVGKTVIVQPGERVALAPPAEPAPRDQAPVIAGGPPAAGDPGAIRIVPGESAIIHDLEPVVTAKIDLARKCAGGGTLHVGGQRTRDGFVAVHETSPPYRLVCDDGTEAASGLVVLRRGDGRRPLAKPDPAVDVTTDGRLYRLSFSHAIPTIRVTGGSGPLSVERDGAVRTYDAPEIPGADLSVGTYRIWFARDKATTVTISFDPDAPVLSFARPAPDATWDDDVVEIAGTALPGALVAGAPVDASGRFAIRHPRAASIALRVDHPHAGLHFYVLRSPTNRDVTIAPTCDEVSCVLNNYAGACCAKYRAAERLEHGDIDDVIAKLEHRIRACNSVSAVGGKVKLWVKVAPDGSVLETQDKLTPSPALASCVADVIKSARFPATKHGDSFTRPFVFAGAATACDAERLRDAGLKAVTRGQHTTALALFERSLECKEDSYTIELAFMASCNGGNQTKARTYFNLLSNGKAARLRVMCDRNNVALEDEVGYLELHTNPPAQVIVDGRDTKLTTPVTGTDLAVQPGRHKITFVVGVDRYTYTVTVKAGATEILRKDLR